MFNILKHLKQILTVCTLLAITDCIFILLLENNNNDLNKKKCEKCILTVVETYGTLARWFVPFIYCFVVFPLGKQIELFVGTQF